MMGGCSSGNSSSSQPVALPAFLEEHHFGNYYASERRAGPVMVGNEEEDYLRRSASYDLPVSHHVREVGSPDFSSGLWKKDDGSDFSRREIALLVFDLDPRPLANRLRQHMVRRDAKKPVGHQFAEAFAMSWRAAVLGLVERIPHTVSQPPPACDVDVAVMEEGQKQKLEIQATKAKASPSPPVLVWRGSGGLLPRIGLRSLGAQKSPPRPGMAVAMDSKDLFEEADRIAAPILDYAGVLTLPEEQGRNRPLLAPVDSDETSDHHASETWIQRLVWTLEKRASEEESAACAPQNAPNEMRST